MNVRLTPQSGSLSLNDKSGLSSDSQTSKRRAAKGWRLALVLLASIGFAPNLYATNIYKMEILVFLRNDPQLITNETFPPQPPLPLPSQYLQLSSNPQADNELAIQSLSGLAGDYNQLKRSANYKVLYAAAWTQTLTSEQYAKPVVIRDQEIAPGIYRLDGSLKISLSHYLHADLDLEYTNFVADGSAGAQSAVSTIANAPTSANDTPAASSTTQTTAGAAQTVDAATTMTATTGATPIAADSAATAATPATPSLVFPPPGWQAVSTYRNQTQRRMRSREVHYLDNPYLGVLLYAFPIQTDKSAEAAPDNSGDNSDTIDDSGDNSTTAEPSRSSD